MKIKEFQSILGKKKIDAAVFYNSDSSKYNPNMFYFSQYSGIGALVIPAEKPAFLIAPKMELQRARHSMVKNVFSMEKKRFFESIKTVLKQNRINTGRLAIDKGSFTLNAFRHFKKQFRKSGISDSAPDCIRIREIKSEKEAEFLKISCSHADRIIKKAINNFKDFKTESEAAAFLEYETKKYGLELSFNPIVASGSNGSMPHHEPLNSPIKKGFCVIDFGVKHKGYCSDMTRTIYIGKPSGKENQIYNLLLEIQTGSINQISENKKCSELYDSVNRKLGKYKKYFTHGLGHGVGVEIHEMPNLTLNSKDKIQNNMVFTIEPGVYFPKKFGIRIEDTILFKNKTSVLTKTSKDLLIL